MSERLSDALTLARNLQGRWISYTPTVKQGTTNLNATFLYAKYMRINKTVWIQVHATAGGTGSAGQPISISQPAGLLANTQNLNNRVVGVFQLEDVGSGFYTGTAIAIVDEIRGFTGGGPRGNFMGAEAPSFTAASGDFIAFAVCYELA